MLCHSDTRLTDAATYSYRSFPVRIVLGIQLDPAEDKQRNPEKADEGYEGAVNWLLARGRDGDQFALLFRENVKYDFR